MSPIRNLLFALAACLAIGIFASLRGAFAETHQLSNGKNNNRMASALPPFCGPSGLQAPWLFQDFCGENVLKESDCTLLHVSGDSFCVWNHQGNCIPVLNGVANNCQAIDNEALCVITSFPVNQQPCAWYELGQELFTIPPSPSPALHPVLAPTQVVYEGPGFIRNPTFQGPSLFLADQPTFEPSQQNGLVHEPSFVAPVAFLPSHQVIHEGPAFIADQPTFAPSRQNDHFHGPNFVAPVAFPPSPQVVHESPVFPPSQVIHGSPGLLSPTNVPPSNNNNLPAAAQMLASPTHMPLFLGDVNPTDMVQPDPTDRPTGIPSKDPTDEGVAEETGVSDGSPQTLSDVEGEKEGRSKYPLIIGIVIGCILFVLLAFIFCMMCQPTSATLEARAKTTTKPLVIPGGAGADMQVVSFTSVAATPCAF